MGGRGGVSGGYIEGYGGGTSGGTDILYEIRDADFVLTDTSLEITQTT